jgi:hypothetical protein
MRLVKVVLGAGPPGRQLLGTGVNGGRPEGAPRFWAGCYAPGMRISAS